MLSSPERLVLYSTCPGDTRQVDNSYPDLVRQVARWSEAAGCEGILIYSGNTSLDPFAVAQTILTSTDRLVPLVAVQPVYTHPFTVARILMTFAVMFQRRVDLNLVAGGFRLDLAALGDQVSHDRRYDRLASFAQIVRSLLRGETVSQRDDFYSVTGLRLPVTIPEELEPKFLVSGSSEAGRQCATRVAALPVEYPEPVKDGAAIELAAAPRAMRIGIVAADTHAAAWAAALDKFPDDLEGAAARRAATKVSDSVWHKQLAAVNTPEAPGQDDVYWLGPYRTNSANCPYLVGAYDEVSAYLRRYLDSGVCLIILDVPRARGDLEQALKVTRGALREAKSRV